MSRLYVPLLRRILWTTGDVLLRAELSLAIKTNRPGWEIVPFRVDSGSEMTTMSAFQARRYRIAMPRQASRGAVHQPTGLAIRSGVLRMCVVGMDATEYTIPCYFLGDPLVPISPNPGSASIPRNLLGLSGVVDKLRIIFDGPVASGGIDGDLIVEKR